SRVPISHSKVSSVMMPARYARSSCLNSKSRFMTVRPPCEFFLRECPGFLSRSLLFLPTFRFSVRLTRERQYSRAEKNIRSRCWKRSTVDRSRSCQGCVPVRIARQTNLRFFVLAFQLVGSGKPRRDIGASKALRQNSNSSGPKTWDRGSSAAGGQRDQTI